MTNYNDGKWHGHNGGECPVHPESRVRIATETLSPFEMTAKNINWKHSNDPNLNKVIAFRVIKEYREPREFWIFKSASGDIIHDKDDGSFVKEGFLHVREVLK